MKYPRTLLIAATVLSLLPWIRRAYFIDDPLFLWSAQHIQSAPADFYGGSVNWGGTVERMVDVLQNPPLQSYYLAIVGSLTGFSEVPLHLAMLLPAVAAILGVYSIAARLSSIPWLAAAIALASPAFMLSSTTLMCDVPMLALWVWSIALWLRGIDERDARYLALAGVLMGCCGLAKYFGIALLPLAFVYGLIQQRGLGRWCLWLSIPLAMFIGYEFYSHSLYGRYLIFSAADYAAQASAYQESAWSIRGFLALVYAGAGVAPLALWMPWLWSWRANLVWALAAVGIAVGIAGLETIEGAPLSTPQGIEWNLLVHLTIFTLLGVQVLTLAVADNYRSHDAASLLLGLWVAGTLAFAAWFNWTISGRTILPLAPAVALLITRRLASRAVLIGRAHSVDRRWAIPLAAGLVLSTLLCWSDTLTAGHEKSAAFQLASKHRRSRVNTLWFEGHWGFQYYLEAAGAHCIDYYASDVAPGDVILVQNDSPSLNLAPDEWQPIDFLHSPSPWRLTTQSRDGVASYYSHLMGPLPYRFVEVPPAKYLVYLAREHYTFKVRKPDK